MYEQYYRLSEKPFSLTPDPRYLFLSKHHQGALDHMLYGINEREGFMTITGDVGTGKTTLCRCLLERLDSNIQVALILNPMLSDMDLLRTCVHDLGVRPAAVAYGDTVPLDTIYEKGFLEPDFLPLPTPADVPDMRWVNQASKKELIDALNSFLLAQHASGGSTVLIIDEAQNLTLEVMEQLRILSNLETEKEKLLQIIFVGQLELNDKLNSPELKQLNQRISIRYEIVPLSKQESIQYINHRILVAGAGSRVSFSQPAFKEIYKYSLGYPRLINLVCDRALLSGYNDQVDMIDKAQVNQGIKSLRGDEEKDHTRDYFVRFRLPLIASVLFFLAGLALFLSAELGIDWKSEAHRLLTQAGVKHAWVKKLAPAVKPEKNMSAPPEEMPAVVAVEKIPEPGPADELAIKPSAEKNESASETQGGSLAGETEIGPQFPKEEGNYRIQLYSFKKESQAVDEVKKLQEEGFEGYWKKAVAQDQSWYMVYVGPYNEAQPARIHVNALKFSGRNPILLSVANSR
ncbi:General secretion pathway protein A [hydrothermal vent metagenome]|uniref:General secretion pathway protein A n=1 Tax=hydrothermal vent metagenome TaxID=652676 RepID=A0A3B1D247_9ZZZZ